MKRERDILKEREVGREKERKDVFVFERAYTPARVCFGIF